MAAIPQQMLDENLAMDREQAGLYLPACPMAKTC